MVMRPQNTFNLERIELLRGPSSVVNGQSEPLRLTSARYHSESAIGPVTPAAA